MALATCRGGTLTGRLPTLPVIEHPTSRLANSRGELSVLGSSRTSTSDGKRPLPPLQRTRKKNTRGKNHSRGLTWPFGQDKSLDSLQSFAQTRSVDELEELIRDKLTTGFYGIRQAFRSNDPQGKGNVSKEAFTTILYHLCGYVSSGQVSGFLQRLGVESQALISYDDFISHFKDTEVVQKEWIDPVLRPIQGLADLPANRLKDEQRDRATKQQNEMNRQGQRVTPPTFYSALQVFPLLKRKAQAGVSAMAKVLPTSCFDIDGMILKPQMRQALFHMGIHMYEDEFNKVWDRIDRNGIGAVDSRTFFMALGVGDNEEREPEKKKSPITVRVPELPVEPVEPVMEARHDEQVLPAAESDEKEKPDESLRGADHVTDVMAVLANKFKQGYNNIYERFARYDPDNTGKVSKSDFRQVLASIRLALGPIEIDHFLSRFGVRHEEMVPYREVLDTCQDRSDRGLLQKVMDDSKHRFNKSRESQIGTTTAIDAEARILEILHADFLSLLGAFKQLDRESMGVVKKYQFKELLQARFGIKLTKEQIAKIRLRIGDDPASGLVPYPRFLEEFNCISKHKSPRATQEARSSTSNSQRPSTCPTRPLSVQSAASPRGLDKGATQMDIKRESRDVEELLSQMGSLLTDKFDVINKTFIGIDKASRNCGNLTRETFRKLFERHEFKLSVDDVDRLWKKLPTERDGTLNFIELVKTCFAAAGRTPPSHNDQKEVGHVSRVLQSYARAHVRKTLEKFIEEDEDENQSEVPDEACAEYIPIVEPRDEEPSPRMRTDKTEKPKLETTMNRIKFEVRIRWNQIRDDLTKLDKHDDGTVTPEDFKSVVQTYCKTLTDAECDVLAARFDKKKENTVSYLEFLKYFLPTMPEGTNPVISPRQIKADKIYTQTKARKTPSQTAVVNIMNKIRNKMICDWKTLRRAMKKSDTSGDGMISAMDFRSTMLTFDFRLDDEDFYHIYSAFDVNMDGKISYVEFMKKALE